MKNIYLRGMSQISASTDLGNGDGYVYITNESGTLGTVFGYPIGIKNGLLAINAVRKEFGPRNSKSAGAGYAVGYLTLTNAAADNLNTLTIGGVNQIGGAVAMTAANLVVSAAAIAAAVNAYVAVPNFRASASGASVIFTSVTATDAYNGDLIVPAFSGASTATTIPVGGGRSQGFRPFRFFLDTRPAATELVIDPAAIEITDAVSWNDLGAPVTITTGTIASNTLSFQRLNDGSRMQVQIDGITAVNNGLGIPSNRITSIAFEGGCVGDIVLFSGMNGSGAPAVFVQGADIDIALTTKSLADFNDTLEMRYVGAGQFSQVVPEPIDVAAIRASGLPVPLQPGTFDFAPSGGVAAITPGATGVSAFPGNIYEQNVLLTGAAVVLPANLGFYVDTTSAMNGDCGCIYGNSIPITLAGKTITFYDPDGIKATLSTEMALSGQWTCNWVVVDQSAGIVSFSLVPIFGTANTGFLDTPMYAPLSVTGAVIDNDTIDGATKMIDDSLTEAKLDSLVRAKLNAQGRTTTTVNIPTASVLTLNTVPIEVIPAPGAGFMVVIEKVVGYIAYVAPVYATNVNLQLIYAGAGDAIVESSLLLVKTTTGYQELPFLYTIAAGTTQMISNAAVNARVEVGDPTAGSSDITLYITWSLIAV